MLKAIFCLVSILVAQVHSHGRLMDPPNRSSLFRFEEDPLIKPYMSIVEPNWTDNELSCGGVGTQHQENDGKCGLCGDPYNGVRENEAGGKYGKGIIVKEYDQGAEISVTVELTTHHLGYFEFRLCQWNDPTTPGTFECLNQHVLQQPNGETKYYPEQSSKPWIYTYSLQLPADVKCTQCILQWKYHTENTWNCDSDKCCTGCGAQEEFYGCADIAIGEKTLPPPGWNQPPQTTTLLTKITTQSKPSGNQETTRTTTTTTTTTTTSNENTNSPDEITCVNRPEGKYMADCDTFYTCGPNGAGPYMYDCGPGTMYDELRGICDYPHNVPPPCGSKTTFLH